MEASVVIATLVLLGLGQEASDKGLYGTGALKEQGWNWRDAGCNPTSAMCTLKTTPRSREPRAVVGGFLLGNNSTKGPIDTHICYY